MGILKTYIFCVCSIEFIPVHTHHVGEQNWVFLLSDCL